MIVKNEVSKHKESHDEKKDGTLVRFIQSVFV